MQFLPRLHREIRLQADADQLSHDLVSEFQRNHITIDQFFPAVRVCATVFRPMSFTWGQQVRVDFRPAGSGEVDAVIESRFKLPAFDFTHENEKNVELIEGMLRHLTNQAQTATATAR